MTSDSKDVSIFKSLMEIEIQYYWLGLGLMLIAIEVLVIPSGFALFGGLSALILSILISTEIVASDAYSIQMLVFAGILASITAILWNPIKKFRIGKSAKAYNNMIGQNVKVHTQIKGNKIGQAKFSGTIMNAKIADLQRNKSFEVGDNAKIVKIKDNTIYLGTMD